MCGDYPHGILPQAVRVAPIACASSCAAGACGDRRRGHGVVVGSDDVIPTAPGAPVVRVERRLKAENADCTNVL